MKPLYVALFIPLFGFAMTFATPLSFAQGYGKGHDSSIHGESDSSHSGGNGFAFGHLIAPGWLKKHDMPDLGGFSFLPFGIAKKLGLESDNGHSDRGEEHENHHANKDMSAPLISGISVDTTYATATIAWDTNEPATSTTYVSTSSPVDMGDVHTLLKTSGNFTTSHTAIFGTLTPSTTYYVLIETTDNSGNTSTSSEFSFTTNNAPDATAPVISGISVVPTHNSAAINWSTDENADSAVYVSTSTPVDPAGTTTLKLANSALVTSHSLNATGLDASTTYYALITATDGSNNTSTSSEFSFTTNETPDTTAPVLSGISLSAGTSTADVSWSTDEPATSRAYYSTSTGFALSDSGVATTSDPTLVTSHSLGLTGLATSTTYYLRIESSDASSNAALSSEFSLTTSS